MNTSLPETLVPYLYIKQGLEIGKYLVVRKDGKIHLEMYNGTGFAYNDNSIKYVYLPKIAM